MTEQPTLLKELQSAVQALLDSLDHGDTAGLARRLVPGGPADVASEL
ncbi:MAG: hypothetical protein NTZ05_17215 [Chloroflexi bacterium]|nr:hypothetical protein [Chloroflexota bacterium]